jgi:general secretion pathway protein F
MSNNTHTPLPYALRSDLFAQLAQLERAGIAPQQALDMIKLPDRYQARVAATQRGLARGQNIAQSGLHSGLFTPLEAGLLHAALAAGDPSPSYRRLSGHYQERAQQLSGMKSRLLLPAFMCVLAFVIVPLPHLVSGSLSAGAYVFQALRPIGLAALLIAAGMHFFRRWQMRPADAKPSFMDRWLLSLPFLGNMHRRRNLCDFWQSLSLLLKAGLPMFEALPVALQGAGNALVRGDLSRILPRMQKGATLADALRAIPAIHDKTLIGLVQTGEASGTLPDVLARYSSAEADELSRQQQQLADWVPRIAYAAVAGMIAYGILTSGALGPHVPDIQ